MNPKRRSSIFGTGCLVQFLGLCCVPLSLLTIPTIVGPFILAPLGVWMIFKGSRLASWWECPECGSRLSSKRVRTCPGCRERFE
jgi:hypothetical protein